MRHIFISPHLDDAVLSAGGFIYDRTHTDGARIEIWTLSGGVPPEADSSPLAQFLHAQWGFASAAETVRARRLEDRQAAKIVGATPVHFDFLDCIYRRGADGEWLYPASVFVPPHEADAHLPAAMTSVLAAELKPDDVVYSPLAIGNHVDHVLTRQAAEALGRPLLYYADIPYLLKHPEAIESLGQGKPLAARRVSQAGLDAWVRGIVSYRSQLSSLFESPEKMAHAIAEYAHDGLHFWELA